MNELNISYNISKGHRITNIVIFSYFTGLGLYMCIKNILIASYGIVFFLGLLCILLGIILILRNTVWLSVPILNISNDKVVSNPPNSKSITIDWVAVSRVNIGPGYLVFFLNGGQKQSKIELLSLKYEDLLTVKSKIVELCEYKNIPYSND